MHQTTEIIFSLSIILFLTNITRALSIKFKIPPVIGLILIGKALGPSLLNIVELNRTIEWIAQVGVLFLIFSAGIQTNLQKLKEDSKKASFPAIGGIIVPFLAGFILTYLFNHSLISSIIIGVIFTAASISVPLMTLIDIDKFNSTEGRCIVNSAIINDIFSILLISTLFSITMYQGSGSAYYTGFLPFLKILLFFLIAYLVGRYVIITVFTNNKRLNLESSLLSLSIAVILIYAWFAELLGLEAIMGALLSGFILGQTKAKQFIDSGITQVGKSLFVDIFFVSIGLGLNLRVLSFHPGYLILFIVLAMLSKFFGCFTGALISRFDTVRSLRIGAGLTPRGEVSLIISAAAFHRGLIDTELLSTTIIMVVITSVIAPFLIKLSYATTKKEAF